MTKVEQRALWGVSLAALLVVFGILLANIFHKAGTPVIVRGGSLYGEIDLAQQWKDMSGPNGTTEYYPTGMETGQNEVIQLDNFMDSSGNPLGHQVIHSTGWIIDISNRNGQQGEKGEAVRVCSDADCSKKLDKNGTVYLMTLRHDAKWKKVTTPKANELHFRDEDPNDSCDSSTSPDESKCDTPVAIRVFSKNGPPKKYFCIRKQDDSTDCQITFEK